MSGSRVLMKRLISLAAFVAVVVALVLWLVLRERGTQRDSVVDGAREAGTRGAATLETPIDAAVATPRERTAVESATPAVGSTAGPSRRDLFALTVVRHTSGAPIAGAEVRALPLDDDEVRAHERRLLPFYERVIEGGARFVSDADGRIELPIPRRAVLVYARHEQLAGSLLLHGSRHDVRQVVLFDDASLDVEVVDEHGAPQIDVPVELSVAGSYGTYTLSSARTRTPDGVAAFEHVGVLLRSRPGSTLFARVAAACDPPVGTLVDEHELASGRVTLVVPPTGELELLVQEADGAPCLEPVPCEIWIQKPEAARSTHSALSPSEEITCEGGRLVVARVGLHGWLSVCPTAASFDSDCVHGASPSGTGERVTLVLRRRVEDEYPELRGRALDPHGAPLRDRELSVGLAHGEPPMAPSWSNVFTDGEGRFRYVMLENPPGASALLLGIIEVRTVVSSARVALAGPIASEGIDVGDVALAPPSIVCAGRVVDDAGEPVSSASIRVEAHGSSSGFPPHFHRATSDETGRFEIAGMLATTEPPVLAVVRAGYGPTRRRFAVGETGIEIVLHAEASIAGSIVPPTKLRLDDVYLSWQTTNATWNRTESMSTRPEIGTGEFLFSGLEPGEYDVLLSAQRLIGPQLELAKLSLRAGEQSRDPRLERIDVDRRLRVFRFETRAPPGHDAPVLAYGARLPNEADFFDDDPAYDGRMTFYSANEELEVRVRGDELRTHVSTYREGTHEIVLKPAYDVRLVLRTGGALPEAPYSLLPMLIARRDGVEDLNRRGQPFDAQRECHIATPEAGQYDVVYHVRRGEFEQSDRFALPQTITVADVDGVQTFEVAVPQEALERALAALRK
ncbi:MAG: carboxypeptidase-like regulatory domain-containing protein [Planctomycetota bacterium]